MLVQSRKMAAPRCTDRMSAFSFVCFYFLMIYSLLDSSLFLRKVIAFPTTTLQRNIPPTKFRIGVLGNRRRIGFKLSQMLSKSPSMSYEVDSDEDAEQHLADEVYADLPATSRPRSGSSSSNAGESGDNRRYDSFLKQVGLGENESLMKQVRELPSKRPVSTNDVFCNRELKMEGLRAIGFDMDYTLAQYQQPAFDRLAFDGAKRKLVYSMGYPEAVLDFEYDHSFWTRGLIIDTQRGNFLKIDRHKYVRVAYHGFDCISSTTRKHLYSRTFNKVMSFTEKHFVNMDTLFQFVDAHLFALLIKMKDEGMSDVLDLKTYQEIYREVRECIDLCHRDGVIKDEVAVNPDKYIVRDPGLIPMLQRYRDSGVKVFLLTNSYWEYTSTAMNYLYHGKKVDEEHQKRNEWMELFDLIIVGSCKPAFLVDPYLNLFRVDPATGSLRNTDGTYEIEALGPDGASKFLQQGKTFQGGNWLHLHAMLEIQAGEELLYVGDHLYADVLRSKRTLGWRSAFIMPELEEEMRVFHKNLELEKDIEALRQLRDEFSLQAEEIRQRILFDKSGGNNGNDERLISITKQDLVLKKRLSELAAEWHRAFHPVWGAMFNAGYQDSRFAFYVQNYACLYTSKATNLGLASIHRSFRTGSLEGLPHDKLLSNRDSLFAEFNPWDSVK